MQYLKPKDRLKKGESKSEMLRRRREGKGHPITPDSVALIRLFVRVRELMKQGGGRESLPEWVCTYCQEHDVVL